MNAERVPWLSLLLLSSMMVVSSTVQAGGGSNTNHELMVYSIEYYDNFYDDCIDQSIRWKPTIPLDNDYEIKDPASSNSTIKGFWYKMYDNCTISQCAHTESYKYTGSQVTVNNMLQADNGWNDADMVFFYGHNTTIRPQWSNPDMELWKTWLDLGSGGWVWCKQEDEWLDWGTATEPYRYHRNLITDASLSNAMAVFYAYNPLTSVLVGEDFVDGTWYSENTYDQTLATARSGRLNSEIEWFVANGCNAVTVAMYQYGDPEDPIVATALGVNAWKDSWNGQHLVMGHYYSTTAIGLPILGGDAANSFNVGLKVGDIMKDAYFDAHTENYEPDPAKYQPAAISVSPQSCCSGTYPLIYCPTGGCAGDFMHTDHWNLTLADLTTNFYYTTSWRVAEN